MKVLITCEESQEVCKSFRELGFEAYSCDIQNCSGGHPEWHIKSDAIKEAYSLKYELMIAHPPCTYISRAGARWMYLKSGVINNERYEKALQAKDFFYKLLNCPIPYIAIENQTPLKILNLPNYSQVIQPYEYGHEFSKRTLLWLKNLPLLKPTKIITEYEPYLPSNTGGKKRGQMYRYKSLTQRQRSKTFTGIAKAMAEQWGDFILKKIQDEFQFKSPTGTYPDAKLHTDFAQFGR